MSVIMLFVLFYDPQVFQSTIILNSQVKDTIWTIQWKFRYHWHFANFIEAVYPSVKLSKQAEVFAHCAHSPWPSRSAKKSDKKFFSLLYVITQILLRIFCNGQGKPTASVVPVQCKRFTYYSVETKFYKEKTLKIFGCKK